ncbi:hypothetical protein [uncultured Bdellovibrio sp.]|uniref:hypothetical protein n=1 Tax=Bdellovibrio sp. HCB-162 TaxID=3394234 RepID=UPI0025D9E33B|nr:hypothetical protein [uncultured Bdellovibrio sp.]
MFKLSVCFGGAVLFLAMQANAATLNLGSDPNTIKAKSRSIEVEYSRNMRNQNQQAVDPDNLPHQGAIVVEEGGGDSAMTVPAPASTNKNVDLHSIPGATNTYYSGTNSFSYPSTLKMRADRKVGAGMAVGGTLGVVGFNMELNFEDADGVLAGFGTGPGYNSFQLAWKHAFDGDYLAPYTSVGYSRWYNSRGRGDDLSKSNILDRVLSDNEKKEGRFGTDFVNASLGLQYNQLSGDFAGISFFGELTAMYEINRSMLLPNGSVGAIYYF